MKPFEYAKPTTEAEAVQFLNEHNGNTAVLAGGTDLISLMKQEIVSPERVVDIKHIPSLQGIQTDGVGVSIGVATTLEEMLEHPLLADYRSLLDVIDGIRSIQVQSMGTVGGDLCHLPNCWYYRNGYGLLGMEKRSSIVAEGDNRYHAIFGNNGPAKFVNASRFAPALIAWGAQVRLIGPQPEQEEIVPLEHFYQSPRSETQSNFKLKPGQLLSHILLPAPGAQQSATYEVVQVEGLDWPLTAAAATLELQAGQVRQARIVLGHVAPTPVVAQEAARVLLGKSLNEATAELAGEVAIRNATPLSGNEYKVQMTKTAVKRALLRAGGLPEGGF